MGLCASADAADAQTTQQQVQPNQQQQQQAKTNGHAAPASPAAASSTTKSSAVSSPRAPNDDDEYRSQLKSIFLHLLDRLVQVLEHDRASAAAVAKLRGGDSYLALFSAPTIEAFLRSYFEVDMAKASGSAIEREQNFAALVKDAQQRLDSTPSNSKSSVSRSEFTNQIKTVTAAIQSELKASSDVLEANQASIPSYPNLKKNFAFFSKCFNFTKGDIEHDNKLLERNIDEIISASSE